MRSSLLRPVMTLITPTVQRWIDEGRRDPDALWARAAEDVGWFRKWDRVFEWDPPTFRWFAGGQTNLGYNAVDRHVLDGHGGRAALIYLNERGERVVLTYAELLLQVRRIAAGLRGLGIGRGDRITIYMPPCPGVDRADAGHGSHRRDSFGRVRRVRRARAWRPHRGERVARRVHDRRHVSQGPERPAVADRRGGPAGGR